MAAFRTYFWEANHEASVTLEFGYQSLCLVITLGEAQCLLAMDDELMSFIFNTVV
jgi:hypothetical protein